MFITDLVISFDCTGKASGAVELSFSLNYTQIKSASVMPETAKSFRLIVKKLCEKTGWLCDGIYCYAFVIRLYM